jgi:hypothetical protein
MDERLFDVHRMDTEFTIEISVLRTGTEFKRLESLAAIRHYRTASPFFQQWMIVAVPCTETEYAAEDELQSG